MNPAHWHLLLNHFPVTGLIMGLVLWIVALQGDRPELYTVALRWMIGMGLLSIPVYLTGEQAHDMFHAIGGFNHDLIEAHEQWATYTTWTLVLTGIIGIAAHIALQRAGGQLSRVWKAVFSLVLILATFLTAYASHLGGEIMHPEIGPGFVPPTPEAGEHHDMHEH